MQKENKGLNLFLKILKLLYYIVITFICVIALFLVFYIFSSSLNANKEDYKPKISIYTIVSPSMTPVINVYDVIINVRPHNEKDIHVGDIITYKSEVPASQGMMITHRVTEIKTEEDGTISYITQGDSNSEPDSLPVAFNQIMGKEILILPSLGKLQFLIADKKGWLLLCLIPIAFFIFKDIGKLIRLFQLKNKVTEVTTSEENIEKKEQEYARKETLIETLIEKEEAKKEEVENQLEELNSNSNDQIEEKIEVLDTDELTKVINEYDKKIEELENMLKRMEETKKKEEAKKEEAKEENFLNKGKVKVVNVEPTKNQKIIVSKKTEKLTNKSRESSAKEELKPILNNKIEQTVSKPKKKKSTLNIRENQITKVTTKKKEKKQKEKFVHIEKTKK